MFDSLNLMDDVSGLERGEIIGADKNDFSTSIIPDPQSSMLAGLGGADPILWSESYNGQPPDYAARRRKRAKLKRAKLVHKSGDKKSKTGNKKSEEGGPGGLLPGNGAGDLNVAQQDMTSDPQLQDNMPNTVGPNPNIYGGFPENDIWGNFELPSPETIDHLKAALKMHHHRPNYAGTR